MLDPGVLGLEFASEIKYYIIHYTCKKQAYIFYMNITYKYVKEYASIYLSVYISTVYLSIYIPTYLSLHAVDITQAHPTCHFLAFAQTQ